MGVCREAKAPVDDCTDRLRAACAAREGGELHRRRVLAAEGMSAAKLTPVSVKVATISISPSAWLLGAEVRDRR